MKAIETHYKGYRFRSRLEARWAVFFDTIGMKWEYEKEGFEFENGLTYLPDFYLPESETWVEIKGESPRATEIEKAMELALHSKKFVYIFVGIPESDCARYGLEMHVYKFMPITQEFLQMMKNDYGEYGGINRVENMERNGGTVVYSFEDMGNLCNWPNEIYRKACLAAKRARFEHGENGGIVNAEL